MISQNTFGTVKRKIVPIEAGYMFFKKIHIQWNARFVFTDLVCEVTVMAQEWGTSTLVECWPLCIFSHPPLLFSGRCPLPKGRLVKQPQRKIAPAKSRDMFCRTSWKVVTDSIYEVTTCSTHFSSSASFSVLVHTELFSSSTLVECWPLCIFSHPPLLFFGRCPLPKGRLVKQPHHRSERSCGKHSSTL